MPRGNAPTTVTVLQTSTATDTTGLVGKVRGFALTFRTVDIGKSARKGFVRSVSVPPTAPATRPAAFLLESARSTARTATRDTTIIGRVDIHVLTVSVICCL